MKKKKVIILSVINLVFIFMLLCLRFITKMSSLKLWIVIGGVGVATICGLYYIITSIILKRKKPENTILQDSAEHYLSENINENGYLYLTHDKLIFVPRVGAKTVILIKDILQVCKTAGYYTRFDVINKTNESDTYAVTDKDYWIEEISKIIQNNRENI